MDINLDTEDDSELDYQRERLALAQRHVDFARDSVRNARRHLRRVRFNSREYHAWKYDEQAALHDLRQAQNHLRNLQLQIH